MECDDYGLIFIGIILASVLLSAFADKSGIPMLFIFIVLVWLSVAHRCWRLLIILESPTRSARSRLFLLCFWRIRNELACCKPVAGKAIILASLGVFHSRHYGIVCSFCSGLSADRIVSARQRDWFNRCSVRFFDSQATSIVAQRQYTTLVGNGTG